MQKAETGALAAFVNKIAAVPKAEADKLEAERPKSPRRKRKGKSKTATR